METFLAFTLGLILLCGPGEAAQLSVQTTAELDQAIKAAQPGDVITLAPGTYPTTGFRVRAAGTADQPITLRAGVLGEARIEAKGLVAFSLNAPHWHFENLDIVGQCEAASHSSCEHAFHITGNSDGVRIQSSRLVNFNAAIKGNGLPTKSGRVFPDDVIIERSYIYNMESRRTRAPVTSIDVVGGQRWKIIDNFLADYGRVDGKAAYHGFLKGHSRDGLMARNFVICNWRHQGPGRVGLSLGGGGVGDHVKDICEDGLCKVEHTGGEISGNIVTQCHTEPGLYLNAAENTKVSGNLFFHTTGIQLHSEYTSADIKGNILNGGVRDRLGSTHTASGNQIYGTKYGAYLPALSAHIQRFLEGQDKKHPGLIKPWMVSSAQSFVGWVFDLIVSSPMGLGTWSMSGIVKDADSLDVTLKSPRDFRQSGLTYDQSETDFCGRPRDKDAAAGPLVGALEPCNATQRLKAVLALEQQYPI